MPQIRRDHEHIRPLCPKHYKVMVGIANAELIVTLTGSCYFENPKFELSERGLREPRICAM